MTCLADVRKVYHLNINLQNDVPTKESTTTITTSIVVCKNYRQDSLVCEAKV